MSGDPLRIGVCGVGTVGLATIEILRQQSDLISVRAGRAVQVRHVGARRDHADHDYGDARVSRDVMESRARPRGGRAG